MERALRFLLLADVAGDLSEADQLAGLVVDGIDDDAGPEAGAVLANAPAFGFELAFLGGGPQRFRRNAGCLILLGIEAREVAPDDLVGLVALEATRAGIPGGDMPLPVEHVDGVIGDRVDEQLEALLVDMALEPGGFSHSSPTTSPARGRLKFLVLAPQAFILVKRGTGSEGKTSPARSAMTEG
jgi:hypothetical protein